MSVSFEADERVGELFEAYSLDCVDLARENFGFHLSVTDDGVRTVEKMAGMLHDEMPPGGVPDEVLDQMEKKLGSHLAQVLIVTRNWMPGVAVFAEGAMPAVQAADGAHMVWPWAKAHKRIVDGGEDNLWHYFQVITDQLGPPVDIDSLVSP